MSLHKVVNEIGFCSSHMQKGLCMNIDKVLLPHLYLARVVIISTVRCHYHPRNLQHQVVRYPWACEDGILAGSRIQADHVNSWPALKWPLKMENRKMKICVVWFIGTSCIVFRTDKWNALMRAQVDEDECICNQRRVKNAGLFFTWVICIKVFMRPCLRMKYRAWKYKSLSSFISMTCRYLEEI